jgi:hypothetical protein
VISFVFLPGTSYDTSLQYILFYKDIIASQRTAQSFLCQLEKPPEASTKFLPGGAPYFESSPLFDSTEEEDEDGESGDWYFT